MTILSAKERYEQQREAYRNRDMSTVKRLANEARENLFRNGYVRALPVWSWIKKEWLDKAIAEGVVVKKEDGYYPVAIETQELVIEGYRGRTPIINGTKIKLDTSKFMNFLKRYEEYENNQSQ